jgi:hypothetical protein
MSTLEQKMFISEMENDLRTANGPIRHLEFLSNFNKSFRIFKALTKDLPRRKCVNRFLETGSILRKKGSGGPTKRTAENIEELYKELQRPQINPSGD